METKTVEQKVEQSVYSAGLEISCLPNILNYFTNDVLDLTGLVVNMNKSDGSQITLSESEYTAEPANGSVLTEDGNHAVKITAEGRTVCFAISVSKKEIPSDSEVYSVGLEIANLPNNLNYLPNQNLDLSGLVIKKNMSDGTCVTLSDDEYTTEPENGFLLSEVGTMPIKIISDNKTIFFTINVSETILTGIEITSMPTKIGYEDGEVFTSEGLEISAVYSTNSSTTSNLLSEEQYKLNIEDGASLESGKDLKVVVSYYNKTVSYIIHVGAKTSESYEFLDDGSHVLPAICKQNENLKRVVIPETVIEIIDYAFNGCTKLENISLPNSLIKIGKYAFKDCIMLEELDIPDSVANIYEYAFDGCGLSEIRLPRNLTQLLWNTFQNCEQLQKVILNDSLNLISKGAFKNCKELNEIVWSNSVEVVGLAAFYGCTSLENLILPSSITEIAVNVAACGYVKDYISKLSYEGTMEDFNTINIVGTYLVGTMIHCSDGSFVYGEE